MWPPLTGGGYWAALVQVTTVYYGYAAILHWLIPAVVPASALPSLQVAPRRPGQVAAEAAHSLGE